MIVLDILCDNGHRFEGWFASGDEFRRQSGRQLVHCPQCDSASVTQMPSAPHVKRGATGIAPVDGPPPSATMAVASQVRQALLTMARRAENVGERFPEEARRIHYDEAPERAIRGVATVDETRDLLDEGILVLPALVPSDDELH